jgi:hypothetical protein
MFFHFKDEFIHTEDVEGLIRIIHRPIEMIMSFELMIKIINCKYINSEY